MSFGENLREALELANFKQIDFAKKTGISIKSIESYLKSDAKTIPSADKAVKMAKVLGVTVEFLVNGQQNKEAQNNQNRNSKIIPILGKLDKYNFEAVISIAKALLELQVRKAYKN